MSNARQRKLDGKRINLRRGHPPPDIGPLDPQLSAREAGLRYVTDTLPGIRRVRRGRGFRYLDVSGRPIREEKEIRRIRSLVIPPAWTNVWICPNPQGHLQATGRDARGRKQYRYHPAWRKVRDETKYDRILTFAEALPIIRRRCTEDLRLPGLPLEKVLATVVQLLEKTLIRVGNEEYARQNASYGLTTLRDRHVDVSGATVRFEFRGKSGIQHAVDLRDRRLASIVKRCRDLPGQELFQYIGGDGTRQTIDSADVNAYVKAITGQDFTSKDFRTWSGTVLAACALRDAAPFDSQTQAKRNVVLAVESVAKRLGNTRAVCRKCYIHPAVLDAYFNGVTLDAPPARSSGRVALKHPGLEADEVAVLMLLQQQLSRVSQSRSPSKKTA